MQPFDIVIFVATGQIVLANSVLSGTNPFAPPRTRQISSDARECHADCGYTIIEASLPDHCTNSTWTDLLEDCLDCALEYDIWKDYKDGVSEAAKGCGLNATPEPPDDTTTTTTSSPASATASAGLSSTAKTSTGIATSTEITTSTVEPTVSTSSSTVSSRWEISYIYIHPNIAAATSNIFDTR